LQRAITARGFPYRLKEECAPVVMNRVAKKILAGEKVEKEPVAYDQTI